MFNRFKRTTFFLSALAVIGLAVFFYMLYTEPAVSVTSYGGAGQVSGSLHMLRTEHSLGLIDCGNFYPEGEGDYRARTERAGRLNARLPSRALQADYVLVTHAHLDHIGRLPLLVDKGFKGRIYATQATANLMRPMLKSAVRYAQTERKWVYTLRSKKFYKGQDRPVIIAHWYNCKYQKRIRNPKTFRGSLSELEEKTGMAVSPCRVCANIQRDRVMDLVRVVDFHKKFKPSGDVTAVFLPAEHIPGSASVYVEVEAKGKKKRLLFSGDIGSSFSLLQKSLPVAPKVDFLWLETTYGDISREKSMELFRRFGKETGEMLRQGKLVWIPAFALDRTQKVLYALRLAEKNNYLPLGTEIYVTSPLANLFNKVYNTEQQSRVWNCFNERVYNEIRMFPAYRRGLGTDPVQLKGPAVLISTSGMMDNGMSEELLDDLLPRPDVSVCIVGYQDPGTPGGQLLQHRKTIVWKGKEIDVHAGVHKYSFFSAHADFDDALHFLKNQSKKRTKILLIHGEKNLLKARKRALEKEGFEKVVIPQKGEKVVVID